MAEVEVGRRDSVAVRRVARGRRIVGLCWRGFASELRREQTTGYTLFSTSECRGNEIYHNAVGEKEGRRKDPTCQFVSSRKFLKLSPRAT